MKILIIKTHAIGDVLMATPGFRALRQTYPQAHITLLVGTWSYDIVKNNPNIDDFITVPDEIFFKKNWFALIKLLVSIKSKKFDMAFAFHPSPFIHLIPFLCGIPKRYGLSRNGRKMFLTNWADENTGNDFYYPVNFLKVVHLANDKILLNDYYPEINTGAAELKIPQINNGDKYIVVAPGGARNPKETISSRIWPLEYYITTLQMIRTKYPDYSIILTGGDSDKIISDSIKTAVPSVIDVTGKTTLLELTLLIKNAAAVVCNDSSVLHIAIAQKKPVLSFFGPTSMLSRIPLEQSAMSFQSIVDCSPCYKFAIFKGCKKNHACMKSITPEMAMENIEELLSIEQL